MTDEPSAIRKAETIADYRACQAAQRLAWGITDDTYIIPLATMVGAQHHGGLVLGAFRPDGEALGLSFAFLGKIRDRPCLYSQLTGVVPGQQGLGLGGRLKQAQREFAQAQGLACLAWSFDPLQSGNARFNLDRLGATSSRYIPDMYGPRTDALNADAPTDRLIVEWEADPAASPASKVAYEDALNLPRWPSIVDPSGLAKSPGGVPDGPTTVLEIPADIASIRREDGVLAGAWVRGVRQSFEAAFARGYRAVGFVRGEVEGHLRCFYVLSRP